MNVPKIQPGIFGIFGNNLNSGGDPSVWLHSRKSKAKDSPPASSTNARGTVFCFSAIHICVCVRRFLFLVQRWVSPTDRTTARAGGCIVRKAMSCFVLIIFPHGSFDCALSITLRYTATMRRFILRLLNDEWRALAGFFVLAVVRRWCWLCQVEGLQSLW